MALDPYRREIPPATGVTPDWRGMITGFSASIGGYIPVANATDQAQLVADIQTSGVTIDVSHPVVTFRADAAAGQEIEYTIDGTTWRTVAGSDPSLIKLNYLQYYQDYGNGFAAPTLTFDGRWVVLTSGFVGRSGGATVTATTGYSITSPAPTIYWPSEVQTAQGAIHLSKATPILATIRIGIDGVIQYISAASGTFGATSGSYLEIPDKQWLRAN